MVTRTIRECDLCGKECPYETIYAKVDRRADGAGSMEDVHEYLDLCPVHLRALVQKMVNEMDFDQVMKWLKRAKEKPKPVRF